jgi:hypothetical protein
MWQEQLLGLSQELWRLLVAQLQNQFLGGSLALALAGVVSSVCFRLAAGVTAWLHARVFLEFEFVPNTAAHAALQRWLLLQPGALYASPKRVSLSDGLVKEVRFTPLFNNSRSIRIFWEGCLILVSTSSSSSAESSGWAGFTGGYPGGLGFGAGGGGEQRGVEGRGQGADGRISLKVMGWGREAAVSNAVEIGDKLAKEQAVHRTQIFRVSRSRSYSGGGRGGASWIDGGLRPSRPVDSVVLEGDAADALVHDAREFFASERWYRSTNPRKALRTSINFDEFVKFWC